MVRLIDLRFPAQSTFRAFLVWSLLASSAPAAIVVSTDSPIDWLGTGTLPGAGWNSSLAFDDSAWTTSYPGMFFPSFDGLPFGTIWWNASNSGIHGWFRREFTLSGTLVNPRVDAFFDDDGELYVNGNLIFNDNSGSADNALLNFDVAPYLALGTNLIAFHVYDTFGGGVTAACGWKPTA